MTHSTIVGWREAVDFNLVTRNLCLLPALQDCEEMPPQMLMAAMEAGMRGRDQMPASTPPQQAMRGYDLGPASSIAFDSVRDPLQSIKDIFSLFKM